MAKRGADDKTGGKDVMQSASRSLINLSNNCKCCRDIFQLGLDVTISQTSCTLKNTTSRLSTTITDPSQSVSTVNITLSITRSVSHSLSPTLSDCGCGCC